MADKPLRFLDFPSEIRDDIYEAILCNLILPPGCPHHPDHDHPDRIKMYRMETNILLTNRQVHREASDVLQKRAQLVYIKARGIMLSSMLLYYQIPILSAKYKTLAVLNHVMHDSGSLDNPLVECTEDWDFTIMHRDLEMFCRGLGGETTAICSPRIAVNTKHRIRLKKKFTERVQNRLLQPYRNNLKGLNSVKIVGQIDAATAKDLEEEMKTEPVPEPEEFLQYMTNEKEKGNDSFREGDIDEAMAAWGMGLERIRRAICAKTVWPKLKAKGGQDWAESVAALVFQLNNNKAALVVSELRKDQSRQASSWTHDHNDLVDIVSTCGMMAMETGQVLGISGWVPDQEQEAKLAYRLAVAHRLGRGCLDMAEMSIHRAMELAPDDRAIRKEMEEFEKWETLVMGAAQYLGGS